MPRYRLTGAALAEAWGADPGRSCAVCFHDEDALTLAVEASLCAAGDGLPEVDTVVCASVSAPFAERSMATMVAAACDASATACRDLGGARRAGLGALSLGRALLAAGDSARALVVASDARCAKPRHALEPRLGAGAAALVVGSDAPGAVFLAGATAFADYLEAWRVDGDRCVRSEGARLERTEGHSVPAAAAVSAALSRAGLSADDVRHFATNAADARAAAALAKACGVSPTAVVDAGWGALGDLGTGAAPFGLCAALARAQPGDVMAAVAAADGAEAVILRATDRISEVCARPEPAFHIEGGRAVPGYARLLAWRRVVGSSEDSPEVSAVLLHQEQPMLARRRGYHCRRCELVGYPPAKLCQRCRGETEPTRLGRRGTVFTFTRDRLFASVEPETAMAVVELEGGGRVFVQATDCEPREIEVGTSVELVYRRVHDGGGHPVYYWKARPCPAKEPS